MELSTLAVGLTAFLVGIIVGFYFRGTVGEGRAPRPGQQMETAPEGRSAGEFKAFLVVVEGKDLGKRYPLNNGGLRVGRSPDNDLMLDDPAVSRFHVEIRYENGAFCTCDLESTNGTFVDGERVSKRSLKDGNVIQIGTTALRFCLNP